MCQTCLLFIEYHYLGYWFISKCVHPHCYLEVVQVIEKLAEIFELLESNPFLLLESPNQSLQDVFIVLTIEERVPQQDPGNIFSL